MFERNLTNRNVILEKIRRRVRSGQVRSGQVRSGQVRGCLVPFGAESFVFQFVIQKHSDLDIQTYNLGCCVVWVWNLVADIERGTQAEGV